MRRLFIIRKDLNLSPGKLAAMIAHCAEGFWTRLIQHNLETISGPEGNMYRLNSVFLDSDIVEQYICGIFTKTICEAKNKNQLMKIIDLINEHNNQVIHEDEKLVEDVDYGFINDCCLTELTPENEDGTTTVGIWFKPLPDDIAHKFSKKFKLYRD
jgi:peptidyl-tRNA hydrolase